ncbi:hypothetical protein [Burkholderia contaminans]|uniref:hypothetical protein n=1 Tax=Burkholderia contaminans TaxID=488447 RepID=UPI001452D14F|nr:hypothetical protein [Burkholderia contaminans]VWD00072.1 hypothetical protein BCO18442_02493 [Burkholderia contaminans]
MILFIKQRAFAVGLILFAMMACTRAENPVPANLVGIWATENSQFRGEALWKGDAIYLDSDGIGAGVGGNGNEVLGMEFSVKTYDTKSNILQVDLIDNGKAVSSGSMIFDPVNKTISFATEPGKIYRRRVDRISANMRKSLGLPVKQ